MSLDGKIADVQRQAARFSSAADLVHLEVRVAAVDGVLFGGGTLRAYGTTLSVRNPVLIEQRRQRGQSDQPVHIVWSPSGQLDPGYRFFQQSVPRGLITTLAGAQRWQGDKRFEKLWVMPAERVEPWDWPWLFAQLKQANLHTLALLGGGRLTADLLYHDLIDELYITVCPLLLGGATAPTLVDGDGCLAALAPRLQLISHQAQEDEVFLHYRVRREGK
ncbi:MAG: riboflavin deaminase [Leptolyngbyaceae cyanobacterium SM2_5_2]|nr:riboflavin deaminase [Leptolyngbyaceae cyanobacterium SM2_5_2]